MWGRVAEHQRHQTVNLTGSTLRRCKSCRAHILFMKFEEFEKKIWDMGYGIVAMNHYTIGGKRRTYCVILNSNKKQAFKFEANNSEDVFENIYNQILNIK